MPKMKLSLEELTVESFSPESGGGRRGTVNGHVDSWPCYNSLNGTCLALCTNDGCPPNSFEYASCVATDCGHSCVDDCYTDYCGTGNCGTANTNCGQETCASPDSCAW